MRCCISICLAKSVWLGFFSFTFSRKCLLVFFPDYLSHILQLFVGSSYSELLLTSTTTFFTRQSSFLRNYLCLEMLYVFLGFCLGDYLHLRGHFLHSCTPITVLHTFSLPGLFQLFCTAEFSPPVFTDALRAVSLRRSLAASTAQVLALAHAHSTRWRA